jgi:hypothetical protein
VPQSQVTRKYQEKHLRIEVEDGEIADVLVLLVSQCDDHEDGRGLAYEVVSRNPPERLKYGTPYRTEMKYIKRFEPIGSTTA